MYNDKLVVEHKMNPKNINLLLLHLKNHCPTIQTSSNPVVMAVVETDDNYTYYFFTFDCFIHSTDVVICDDEGVCIREKLWISDIMESAPRIKETDSMIGLKLTELYSALGDAITFGDMNNTRNIENHHQLHITLKLFVSCGQSTEDPICQLHLRTIDHYTEFFVYKYDHEKRIFGAVIVNHGNHSFIEEVFLPARTVFTYSQYIEVVGRSKYLGLTIEEIKEIQTNEL